MAQPQDDPQTLSFEEAMSRLESLIDQIESGEIGIEDALKHYETGSALVRRCRAILDRTEQRIAELNPTGNDGLEIRDTDAGIGADGP